MKTLTKILLGKPEVREKRQEYFENQRAGNFLKLIARRAFEPGYAVREAVYTQGPCKILAVVQGMASTVLHCSLAYDLANKLGEYFAK